MNSVPDSSNKLISSKGRNCPYVAYFPSNFVDGDYGKIGSLSQSAALIFDQLYKFRLYGNYGPDDFIDLNYRYCDDLIYKFRETIKILVDQQILEREKVIKFEYDEDNILIFGRGFLSHSSIGKKRSFGYRFVRPDYRENYHQVEITDKWVIRKLGKYANINKPVLRWLREQNQKLSVVEPPSEELLSIAENDPNLAKLYEEKLRFIQDGKWLFHADDFSGRIHNNLTVLKRETRKYLRVDGIPLIEIDIPCSQWLFLGLFAKKKGISGADLCIRTCENDLYSYIAAKGKWTRSEVKKMLTMKCLFSKNTAKCQKSPIKKAFDASFPEIADFIKRQKEGKANNQGSKPWNKLAKELQVLERKFIVDTVCRRISKEKPTIYVGTIHDSILVQPDNADYVLKMMKEEFAKIRAAPKLTIKPLS